MILLFIFIFNDQVINIDLDIKFENHFDFKTNI
jgi:hypothetical protein